MLGLSGLDFSLGNIIVLIKYILGNPYLFERNVFCSAEALCCGCLCLRR